MHMPNVLGITFLIYYVSIQSRPDFVSQYEALVRFPNVLFMLSVFVFITLFTSFFCYKESILHIQLSHSLQSVAY